MKGVTSLGDSSQQRRVDARANTGATRPPPGRRLVMRDSENKRNHALANSPNSKAELDRIYSSISDGEVEDSAPRKRPMLRKAETDLAVTNNKRMAPSTASFSISIEKSEIKPKPKQSISKIPSERSNIPRPEPTMAQNGRAPVHSRTSGTTRPIVTSSEQQRREERSFSANKRPPISRPATASAVASRSRSTSPAGPSRQRAQNGRVRLIDYLASQAHEDSDSEQGSQEVQEPPSASTTSHSDVPTTPLRNNEMAPRSTLQRTASVKKRTARTYGQQRSIRATDSTLSGFGSQPEDNESQRPLTPPIATDPFAFDDDEDEEPGRPKSNILGLHALRQAGASHRFANELNDLLERIGQPQAPGTLAARSRRAALLEFGRKLQDKHFVSLFCDYAAKDNLFQGIASESDPINASVLLSGLLVLLASAPVPHLMDQLTSDGLGQCLILLMNMDDGLSNLAKQKTYAVSKTGQAALRALQSALLQLNIWGASTETPFQLSPRTVALKVLSLSCTKFASESNRRLVVSVSSALFDVLADGRSILLAEPESSDAPDLLNIRLALPLLQEYPFAALTCDSEVETTARVLPTVATILSRALDSNATNLQDLQTPALRLALIATNTPSLSATFSNKELLYKLAVASVDRLEQLQKSIHQGPLPPQLYSNLILFLGVLINISEHHPPARQCFEYWPGDGTSPLDGLIAVYLANRGASSSAESYEQSSLAVAYGYLAIFLGYLSLNATIQRRLSELSGGQGSYYLLASIREFMAFHEKVADVTTAGVTTSLAALVNELQVNSRKTR